MTYVRNAWYVASWSGDIVPEKPMRMQILGEPIVIWRTASGQIAALEDRCLHRLAPLSQGVCEGEKIRCMYHGMVFDHTGRVTAIPGQDRVAGNLRVRAYPVHERHGSIWIWMGQAAADASLIPPVIGFEHPAYADYITCRSHIDYKAEAKLVFANVLDVSHVPFLHARNRAPESWKHLPFKVTQLARSVRTEFWILTDPGESTSDVSEMYARAEFHVPGAMTTQDKFCATGTNKALDGGAPVFEIADVVTSHMITPMTQRTTRHFFSVGWPRDNPDGITDGGALVAYFEKVVREDRAMIEAQQENLDLTPGWRPLPMPNDRGIILYEKLADGLVREEAAAAPAAARTEGAAIAASHV
jgi:phenylpropionate dioxygenase-like ring-hydroxylating dioxygenase large terminal subunit